MSYKIIRSDKALDDLKEILFYIAETNSPKIAMEYVDKLEKSIKGLSEFPEIGKMSNSRYLRIQGIRVLVVESHLVYYKVSEKEKTVKIYTVRHAKQNYYE